MVQCAITDGSAAERAGWLVQRCEELGAAGVDFLIVRERELERAALVEFVRAVVKVSGAMRVLVAGPADVAREAGAAGVHLSASAAMVERWAGAFVTRSCHTLAEVQRAKGEGVDAVLFGPVFGKTVGGVGVVAGVGLEALREAAAVMPVWALGGVTRENAGECDGAGVAAIRMYFGG